MADGMCICMGCEPAAISCGGCTFDPATQYYLDFYFYAKDLVTCTGTSYVATSNIPLTYVPRGLIATCGSQTITGPTGYWKTAPFTVTIQCSTTFTPVAYSVTVRFVVVCGSMSGGVGAGGGLWAVNVQNNTISEGPTTDAVSGGGACGSYNMSGKPSQSCSPLHFGFTSGEISAMLGSTTPCYVYTGLAVVCSQYVGLPPNTMGESAVAFHE